MTLGAGVVIIIGLVIGWAIQMALAFRQATIYQNRVRRLRRLGPSATGRSGSRIKGIAYCSIAADYAGRVAGAEVLRGLTVFARPRPLPELVGRPLEELVCTGPASTIERAVSDAATTLMTHRAQEGQHESVNSSGGDPWTH
ncbi:MAG: transcriptional regulator GutM [Actinomycetota bacterium]|nr:transcriptional regulator GutM [Actinomycetota bacterium]